MIERSGLMSRAFAAAALCFALSAAPHAAAQAPSAADIRQDRIEELEQLLTQQTAENERLQRDLSNAQAEVTRLQSMVNDLTIVRDAREAPPANATSPAPEPGPPRAAPPEPSAPAAPQQQGTLGTLPAPVPTGDAGQAYSQARTLLNNGRLPEAETAFEGFLQAFPNAETAPDARFWLAFTQLARNNFQPAAAGFLGYLQATPQGPRAPEALVRLGMALGGLERTPQACAAFRDLPRRYPNASQNVRALAARESRALACPAA